MRTAIVLPVHNALEHVQGTLRGVLQTTGPEIQLVIVDDASGPETAAYLARLMDDLNPEQLPYRSSYLLRNERQQLFTRTVNRGIREAYRCGADRIICLNSDVTLKPGWLEWMEKGFANDPAVGIVGYRERFEPERWRHTHFTRQQRPEYVTGHLIGLRVAMLEEIGVLCETDITGRDDPTLAPFLGQAHIGSERILGWRANIAGWKSLYCEYDGCTHDSGGPSWNRDLGWLSRFPLAPLWPACDTLQEPAWDG